MWPGSSNLKRGMQMKDEMDKREILPYNLNVAGLIFFRCVNKETVLSNIRKEVR